MNYQRNLIAKNRIKKRTFHNSFGEYIKGNTGMYFDELSNSYKQPRHNTNKFYKKHSNKMVRRKEIDYCIKGNYYKKFFDYEYMIY